jgi:hypothetical protein
MSAHTNIDAPGSPQRGTPLLESQPSTPLVHGGEGARSFRWYGPCKEAQNDLAMDAHSEAGWTQASAVSLAAVFGSMR